MFLGIIIKMVKKFSYLYETKNGSRVNWGDIHWGEISLFIKEEDFKLPVGSRLRNRDFCVRGISPRNEGNAGYGLVSIDTSNIEDKDPLDVIMDKLGYKPVTKGFWSLI